MSHWHAEESRSTYDYSIRRSPFTYLDIERISGWAEFSFSTSVCGKWSKSNGRIGQLNPKSANNPCFRLALLPTTDSTSRYTVVNLLIFLTQKVDSREASVVLDSNLSQNSNVARSIGCYVLSTRGLVQLATEGGGIDPKHVLGGTMAFEAKMTVSRAFSCRMKTPGLKEEHRDNPQGLSAKTPDPGLELYQEEIGPGLRSGLNCDRIVLSPQHFLAKTESPAFVLPEEKVCVCVCCSHF
jgi:hypothetical protein